jgi:hypothetical protein
MLDEQEALAAVERAAREAEVAAISRQIEELTQRRAAVIEPASWWSSNRAPLIATRRAALRQQLG